MRAILTIILLSMAPACTRAGGSDDPDRLNVVASFYPLAEAARRLGGSCVEVVDLTPPGVEPHDLEITTDSLEAIASADLVVHMGDIGFQPAVEDGVAAATGEVIEVFPERLIDGAIDDPHIWLDPSWFSSIMERMATGLLDAGAPARCGIEENAAAFRDELEVLNAEFSTGLADCRDRVIVTTHAAFGYLSEAYGLRQVPIAGLAPEAEPDAKRIAELRALLVREGITTIFTEDNASPDVAETLAAEVGGRTALLHTIETRPPGGDYLSAMRENLRTLRGALGCA